MEHRLFAPRWRDMRAICLILAFAASACASAPVPPDDEVAAACGIVTANALEARTCAPTGDIPSDASGRTRG
jgi:hypothetical protein